MFPISDAGQRVPPRATLQHYRVLLVEDDTALAAMVADFLSPHGFDVRIEGRGDTAVHRIIQENPDTVVLDIGLPGLNGLGVCQAVRADYRDLILSNGSPAVTIESSKPAD